MPIAKLSFENEQFEVIFQLELLSFGIEIRIYHWTIFKTNKVILICKLVFGSGVAISAKFIILAPSSLLEIYYC